MSGRPLMARCRTCDTEFTLRSLAVSHDGTCPGCGEELCPGWTTLLVEEAENIETLRSALMRALRRVAGLPGVLEVLPDALQTDLFEVPWRRNILTEPRRLADEVQRLRYLLGRLPDGPVEGQFVDDFQTQLEGLAGQLRELGGVMDVHQEATGIAGRPAGDVARSVANELTLDIANLHNADIAGRLDSAEAAADLAERQSEDGNDLRRQEARDASP